MSTADNTKKRRFNIIDVLFIALLIGLVSAGIYRFTATGMIRTADTRIRYTVMIEGVRDLSLPYYHVGLRVFDERARAFIGNIVSVTYEPFTYPLTTAAEDGSMILAERPGTVRIFVEIEAYARITGSAIMIDGAYELKVGSRIKLNTKFIDVEAIITNVTILN